ncbi:unnamed protein product [Mytilus edulis]|uniref:B box-type domain-containing protein n=1 Tax=Mytilus edulis TaxID=6550 RepID=A0A8S3T996_MYTED|nr:unnamed protein product [Mytilus edulis]
MASSVKQLCTICNDDGISNSAVTWCTECEVFFCGDCDKTHSKSHLSKNHKTMSAEDYQKLPTFMQEISSQCRDHKKNVTDKHKKCQDMKPLSDILQQVKSSASVQLFEKDLKDVKENLDTAIKYMKTRISTINTQKTKAIEKIRYMRKSIDDYLNKLEQDLLNDLESKHSKLKSNMASLMQQMEQRASQINQIQSQFFRNDTIYYRATKISKIIQTIKLSHNCFGVASDGKTLVITDSYSQCTTVNLSDMSHTILEGMRGVYCISLFQGNIYGTNNGANKVCCYKATGEPLWTFQHQDIARPRGLTLDKNGFVYIASYGNNSILVVSPDGKICKTILSDADGIKDPHAIDINRETGLMIVSSLTNQKNELSYQTCFVYKV